MNGRVSWDTLDEILGRCEVDVLRMYYGCRGGLSEEKVIIPDLMAKKIERLRKDLKKYGKHKENCFSIRGGQHCTCGLQQALKGEK